MVDYISLLRHINAISQRRRKRNPHNQFFLCGIDYSTFEFCALVIISRSSISDRVKCKSIVVGLQYSKLADDVCPFLSIGYKRYQIENTHTKKKNVKLFCIGTSLLCGECVIITALLKSDVKYVNFPLYLTPQPLR